MELATKSSINKHGVVLAPTGQYDTKAIVLTTLPALVAPAIVNPFSNSNVGARAPLLSTPTSVLPVQVGALSPSSLATSPISTIPASMLTDANASAPTSASPLVNPFAAGSEYAKTGSIRMKHGYENVLQEDFKKKHGYENVTNEGFVKKKGYENVPTESFKKKHGYENIKIVPGINKGSTSTDLPPLEAALEVVNTDLPLDGDAPTDNQPGTS